MWKTIVITLLLRISRASFKTEAESWSKIISPSVKPPSTYVNKTKKSKSAGISFNILCHLNCAFQTTNSLFSLRISFFKKSFPAQDAIRTHVWRLGIKSRGIHSFWTSCWLLVQSFQGECQPWIVSSLNAFRLVQVSRKENNN